MTDDVKQLDGLPIIPEGYKLLVEGVVYGQQPSMKNRNRIVHSKGKTMIIHSKEVYAYERSFEEQAKNHPEWKIKAGSADQMLALYASVWYKSRLSDLSVDLIKDLFQKNETINNDRWIIEEHLWNGISKTAPRIHFRIYEIPQGTPTPNFVRTVA